MKDNKKINKYLYGGQPAEVTPAARVKGVIIRTLHGALMFRVYCDSENFTDYELRHDDLSVIISKGELAAFTKSAKGTSSIIPQVLGLETIED